MLVKKEFNMVGSRETYAGDFDKLEVQGSKELAVLCPVSKLTGFPMSLQQAVFMITDKNVRIADALLQVLPTIPSDDSISDTDKLKLLVSRLDTGSFAENDHLAEALGEVAKQFFPEAKVDEVVIDSKIVFDNGNSSSDGE